MRFSFLLPVFMTAFALGGCASVMTDQTKDITVRTPGAEHARCLLDNGTVVMPARTGETVRINKNYKDLTVTCDAPGNRTVTKVFDLEFEPWTMANVVNGLIPGVTYDVASKGIYDYPDEIVINFTGLKATEYPPPQYESLDTIHSDEVVLEEYLPGEPALNSDRGQTDRDLKKISPSERTGYNPFVPSAGGDSSSGPASLTNK